jgi:hypothetical protein
MSAFRSVVPAKRARFISVHRLQTAARVKLHKWWCIGVLMAGCGTQSPHVEGLTAPGIEIAPGSAFVPTLVIIERSHTDSGQYAPYDQYDVLMSDDTGGHFVASTRIHWNYGVPVEGQTYRAVGLPKSFTDQVPAIEGLFTVPALYHFVGGTVTYTALGHDAGDLASVVFDIEYEGGNRLKGRAAEPLQVMPP